MDHHETETTGRRNLLNGLVTAATKSWRQGLNQNGHASNAMVFPTIATAVNTSSPTSRTRATESITMAEEQFRRLQRNRHQDHRHNVLWYGGDDLHQQSQTAYDWEKQPLRQQQRKSQKSQSRLNLKIKRPALPGVPVVWAAVLLAVYALAMAAVYHVYGVTTGSGWVWLRGNVGSNFSVMWLLQIPATWYYVVQSFCATAIGFFLCQWCCQQEKQQKRFCYYALLILFSTTLFPSVPIAGIFNNGSKVISMSASLDNTTTERQHLINNFNSEDFYDNRLSLYEGLWQVSFFIFLAYCLVLPMDVPEKSAKQNDQHIDDEMKEALNNGNKSCPVTIAVLIFTIITSIGHTSLNAYIAYRWYFQKYRHQENSLIKPVAAIQQVCLLVITLTNYFMRLKFCFGDHINNY